MPDKSPAVWARLQLTEPLLNFYNSKLHAKGLLILSAWNPRKSNNISTWHAA